MKNTIQNRNKIKKYKNIENNIRCKTLKQFLQLHNRHNNAYTHKQSHGYYRGGAWYNGWFDNLLSKFSTKQKSFKHTHVQNINSKNKPLEPLEPLEPLKSQKSLEPQKLKLFTDTQLKEINKILNDTINPEKNNELINNIIKNKKINIIQQSTNNSNINNLTQSQLEPDTQTQLHTQIQIETHPQPQTQPQEFNTLTNGLNVETMNNQQLLQLSQIENFFNLKYKMRLDNEELQNIFNTVKFMSNNIDINSNILYDINNNNNNNNNVESLNNITNTLKDKKMKLCFQFLKLVLINNIIQNMTGLDTSILIRIINLFINILNIINETYKKYEIYEIYENGYFYIVLFITYLKYLKCIYDKDYEKSKDCKKSKTWNNVPCSENDSGSENDSDLENDSDTFIGYLESHAEENKKINETKLTDNQKENYKKFITQYNIHNIKILTEILRFLKPIMLSKKDYIKIEPLYIEIDKVINIIIVDLNEQKEQTQQIKKSANIVSRALQNRSGGRKNKSKRRNIKLNK